MKRVHWGSLRRRTKAALIVLATVRFILYVGTLTSHFLEGPEPILIGTLWLIGLAVLALMGFRWAIWIVIAGDAVMIFFGLLTLPEFGHLHGGEIYAYMAVPAVIELVAGIIALRTMHAQKSPARHPLT
jgi:hypothetical protein